MSLNRRDFLKFSTAGVGGLALFSTLKPDRVSGATPPTRWTEKAMLNDTSKCIGCRACQTACRRWNNRPEESNGYNTFYDNPSDLTAETWTLVKGKEYQVNGSTELLLAKYQCMHCTDAACVKVCPTKALHYNLLGFVAYDKNLCSGCGYCLEACPFSVPRRSGSKLTGWGKMDKCTFCQDRVIYGQMPACAEVCPAGAITYGNRDQIVEEGVTRVNVLKQSYPNATLYGAEELGGLHVIYVLKESPDVYQLPIDPKVPGSATAWQDILQPVGYGLAGAVTLGVLANLIVTRIRMPAHEKDKRR